MCKIDFGIVTVLGIERKAINGRLEGVKTIPGDPPDIREYYRGRLTLADGTAYELAVVQCNQAGNSDAGQAAKDLLLRWSPNYLIMLGVAGGIPRGNLKIGDVVVATEVVEYDYRRFFNHNWDPRPRHHTTDAGLLTKVLAAPDWDGHDVPPTLPKSRGMEARTTKARPNSCRQRFVRGRTGSRSPPQDATGSDCHRDGKPLLRLGKDGRQPPCS